METSEKFINWLEGYLDACKNKLTIPQVKEIRKKITEYHVARESDLLPLWDSTYPGAVSLKGAYNSFNNTAVNEEYLKEVERNSKASTMEELS
jgi:hypothetical protein